MSRANRRQWIRRVVFSVLLLLWMGLVFGFSAQNAATSSQLSGGVCHTIASLLWDDFETLPIVQQQEIIGTLQVIVRKTAHFCEYALGGALALGFFMTFSFSRRKQVLCAVLFVAANAVLDEGHQLFVDGRAPMVTDILLDTAGGLCAIGAILGIGYLRQRRRQGLDNSAVFDNNNKEE